MFLSSTPVQVFSVLSKWYADVDAFKQHQLPRLDVE